MKKQIIGTSIVSVILLTMTTNKPVSATTTEPTPTITPETLVVLAPPVPLVKYPKPIPMESFWDELARCETNSNWKNGGNWAGGLGIARSTWSGFGGKQFASTPDKATREEQIQVANNIAIFGWQTNSYLSTEDREKKKPFFRSPVGFNGWGALGCAGGTPALVKHTPETVMEQKFRWGQKGRLVGDLQAILGVKQDFSYGSITYAAHQRFIMKHGKSRDLSPSKPKLKRPTTIPNSPTKRCPQFEQLAYDAGFPENQISIVSYLMWRESRCVVNATNGKDPVGGSRGLLQINGFWTKHLIKDGVIKNEKQLFDPATNLRAGFYVWTHALMKARYNYGWSPWSIW
jgi:hypothetical protein